ncbi:MAG: excinuclease ABC subunit UvrA [Elusimicrobia bacterium]|nr:excinuclease ABC subunit UvrA [Elusimicrobiota bacterium]
MNLNKIIIKGAREHNLKNINLEIPRDKFVVITGLSGSGKSSLAFDTIYAEGQRRYVESLSAYARQFLEQMDKPDVDHIIGLSPAIAIQQKAVSRNPRSTVGTVTEIYDYLRLLFARIGIPHCPQCGREIKPQSVQQIISELLKLSSGTKLTILSPVVKGRKGEYKELFKSILQKGFIRAKIDGKIYELEKPPELEKSKKHDIAVVVDRLIIPPPDGSLKMTSKTNAYGVSSGGGIKSRLSESVETALKLSKGTVTVLTQEPKNSRTQELVFSEHHACTECGISIPEISPRFFSFNSPYGACSGCDGLGTRLEVDENLVVPDKNLSVYDGALLPWSKPITTKRHRWSGAWSGYYFELLQEVSARHRFSLNTPFKKLSRTNQRYLLYGDGEFEGVIGNLERRYKETESEYVREEIFTKYMRSNICEKCRGRRLNDAALAVTVGEQNISQITAMSIKKVSEFFKNLKITDTEKIISKQIVKEITARLSFLENVGLDYITLNRESSTLAGGEAQRISLATQIGSGLVGVLYILDEPTIGLHQRDNHRLIDTLCNLRDLGNTLIVVEHDEKTIESADYIIDLGPGAGENGGKVVVAGDISNVLNEEKSLTGRYLRNKLKIPIPDKSKREIKRLLEIKSAAQFNLKNIDVRIPIGVFTSITGVSGSGKSTLIYEIFYKALCQKIYKSKEIPGKHEKIDGIDFIDKVILVDQSPIGRTPRSNPATYTGLFTPIRDLFSQLPQSKIKGYAPGRFSFNVKGGRCEVCEGDGTKKIEMQFLPDVYVKCEVCHGARFNEETLAIKYKGKNISEVLDMSVEDALKFFGNIPYIKKVLQTLSDVGLGYIKLGQPATTLSGGEAQRVKLATELTKRATGRTVYILDEPTTGLHFADIHKLLEVLHRLVDAGNTVVVIEHNLDVIKTADWIVDLGPEGGDKGGEVVYQGPIKDILKVKNSYTAKYLKDKI